jgi:hypothetical protein
MTQNTACGPEKKTPFPCHSNRQDAKTCFQPRFQPCKKTAKLDHHHLYVQLKNASAALSQYEPNPMPLTLRPPRLQESRCVAGPAHRHIQIRASTDNAASLARRGGCLAPTANTAPDAAPDAADPAGPLEPQSLPPLELSLGPQAALLLLAQLPLGALGHELSGAVARLQLVDGRQQRRDLVARLAQVLFQAAGSLFAPLELGLEIPHRAVRTARAARVGVQRRLGGFDGFFELDAG